MSIGIKSSLEGTKTSPVRKKEGTKASRVGTRYNIKSRMNKEKSSKEKIWKEQKLVEYRNKIKFCGNSNELSMNISRNKKVFRQ